MHSDNLYALLCGIFGPIRSTYTQYLPYGGATTKCDAQLAEHNFQTHLKAVVDSTIS
ncbi:DUF6783 domain-containing protein [Blautia marasmi]|uniref:DUF6783 domain-containing protein n=1 Tax=Blautia marasmi TaxID=1917868 RepID=UPI0035181422